MNNCISYFHYYFFVVSFVLMPFSFYQVYRISEKMKTNVTEINENGEEYEMDIETYNEIQEKIRIEAERNKISSEGESNFKIE